MRLASPTFLDRFLFLGLLASFWFLVPAVFEWTVRRWGYDASTVTIALADNAWLLQVAALFFAWSIFSYTQAFSVSYMMKRLFVRHAWGHLFAGMMQGFWVVLGCVGLGVFLGLTRIEAPNEVVEAWIHFFPVWLSQGITVVVWVLLVDRVRAELVRQWVNGNASPLVGQLFLVLLEAVVLISLFWSPDLGLESWVSFVALWLVICKALWNQLMSRMLVTAGEQSRFLGWELGFWFSSYLIFGQWRLGFKGTSFFYIFDGPGADLWESWSRYGWFGQPIAWLAFPFVMSLALTWVGRQKSAKTIFAAKSSPLISSPSKI